MNIYKERGRFIENVKQKIILSLWDFFSVAGVFIILCVHKRLDINNPLCTVSKRLVLNAAVWRKAPAVRGNRIGAVCPPRHVVQFQ